MFSTIRWVLGSIDKAVTDIFNGPDRIDRVTISRGISNINFDVVEENTDNYKITLRIALENDGIQINIERSKAKEIALFLLKYAEMK